jgi:4-carboxymuconolactone decarboxylase
MSFVGRQQYTLRAMKIYRVLLKGEYKMSNEKELTAAQRMIGEFSPKIVELTDDVLFGDVWERKELSPRDRSLITVSNLITSGNTEQLGFHLNKAKENGISEEELKEVITHLAFYAGWPKAMSAIMVAKEVFSKGK